MFDLHVSCILFTHDQPLDLYGLARHKIVGAQRLPWQADGRITVLEVMTEKKQVNHLERGRVMVYGPASL